MWRLILVHLWESSQSQDEIFQILLLPIRIFNIPNNYNMCKKSWRLGELLAIFLLPKIKSIQIMITPLARKVEVKGKCCNSYSHYRECGDRLQLPIVQEKSMPESRFIDMAMAKTSRSLLTFATSQLMQPTQKLCFLMYKGQPLERARRWPFRRHSRCKIWIVWCVV